MDMAGLMVSLLVGIAALPIAGSIWLIWWVYADLTGDPGSRRRADLL
jgi:hypothetical protein